MKQFTSIVVIISLILAGNTIGHEEFLEDSGFTNDQPREVEVDLEQIKKRNSLKAITTYSSTNYFLYKGRPMGYEYELLQRLAEHLDVNLEIITAKDKEDAYRMLWNGDGDIIAMGLKINAENKSKAEFTLPHRSTKYVLVQKMPWNWHSLKLHQIEKLLVREPFQIGDRPVYVRENSAHLHRLSNLEEEMGTDFNIVEVPGYMTTYELMEKVDKGEFEFAVVDENQAKINQADFPNLDINTALSLPVHTGWAVRKSSPELLKATNQWLDLMRNNVDYYVIYNKYFKNRTFFKRRMESKFYSKAGNEISPYDELIRKKSKDYDWRFIASLIYQESQFKPDTNSWVGAVGLMQLMPSTAKAFGVKDAKDPEENISAGVAYLDYLMDYWEEIPDSLQRVKFSLASYNCGMAHVLDAQKLAEKYDYDPNVWDDNVEIFIRKLDEPEYFTDPVVKYGYCRGEEPFQYVRHIFERYKHYQRFIPNKEEFALMATVENYNPYKVF